MPMHVCMCPAAHAEAANCSFGACGCPEAQATDSMILMPPFQEIVYLSALQLKASATKYASKLAAAIKTGKELELLKLSGEAIANNKRHQKEYEKQLQVRQDYLVAGAWFSVCFGGKGHRGAGAGEVFVPHKGDRSQEMQADRHQIQLLKASIVACRAA